MVKKKKKPEIELIEAGSEIVGGVAGAALGFLAEGPAGAIGGVLIGGASVPIIVHSLQQVGRELKSRLLGPREEIRIGATMSYAIEKIKENLEHGQQLRTDGFFDCELDNRASIDEIYEGILLSAQREHEEKKIPFLGNLMANIAFHPEIDKYYANLLIKIAKDLSYRQLCILSILRDKEFFKLNLAHIGDGGQDTRLRELIMEIHDLHRKGLINAPEFLGFVLPPVLNPKYDIQGVGKSLIDLMELENIPEGDRDQITSILGFI